MPRNRREPLMSPRLRGMRLRTKLLALLLAFGVLPCGVSIVVGYSVSRAIITRQAERALRELTVQQALHLAAEVSRERLLLRTIAGRLPPARVLARTLPAMQARELVQSLPEGGVFDGLRLVTPRGGVLASVSLRNVAPRWPPSIPSADWTRTPVAVHREGARVRAEDFRRVLAMPEHLMAGVESAVFERTGEPVLVGHEHAAIDVTAAFAAPEGDSAKVARAVVNDTLSLVVSAPITATDWVLVSVLPLQVALAPLARLRDTAVAGAGA